MKKQLNKAYWAIANKIVAKGLGLTDINLPVFISNYDSLCRSYEYVFANLPHNERRLDILKSSLGTPPSEAYYIIDALFKTTKLDGDVCEFGVAQGVTSTLIANEIMDQKQRKLHLFDSFEGLPEPTEKDQLKDDIFNLGSMKAYKGKMKSPESQVQDRLQSINFPKERIVIHKGFFEDLIPEKKNFPKKVSCAYVDFDFYEPIKIVLEYLDTVTDKGAIIIVDDYDWFSTGVKAAVDEFMEAQGSNYELFVPNAVLGHFAVLTKK